MDKLYFTVEKMTVGYGNKPLIRDIDIELEKGGILTIIGPNGAGKTTILKSITRQLRLISGTVFLNGKSMEEMSGQELSKKLAVVLTDRVRPELFTCRDMVATGRYPYTGKLGVLKGEDWKAVDAAMERVLVTKIAQKDFREISDGQRQRVMLARAICQEPEVLVLDEPTSFLDVRHKLEFMWMLQQMASEGMTIIMSLHELDLAERISDKVVCVRGEYVDRIGSSEEIFHSGYIRSLYEIDTGSFCEENGSVELPAIKDDARVFVIAGGGSGSSLFRRLQRKRVSFATGILQENDMDYPVAKALAARVLSVGAFDEMTQADLEKAKGEIAGCDRVYCPLQKFGRTNAMNQILRDYAAELGKLSGE